MDKKLESLIKDIALDVSNIASERKLELDDIADIIVHHFNEAKQLEIIVVCTHNSRRSQLGEVWINTLVEHLELTNIIAYSGGMEETAFNIRMVNALISCGFEINETEEGNNPKYEVSNLKMKHHVMFSKVYDHEMNPQSGFMAFMVCGDADENCPIVQGMKYRIPLRYKDPKAYDDTNHEVEAYLDKVKEIGREMYYLLDKVKQLS